MPPLTSADRTRREGVSALTVELADGGLWGLALPGPRLDPTPRHEPDGFGGTTTRIELINRVGYPLRVQRLWEDLVSASASDDATGVPDAFHRLASALLLAAHEIEPAEADALLDPSRVDLKGIARVLIPTAFDTTSTGGR